MPDELEPSREPGRHLGRDFGIAAVAGTVGTVGGKVVTDLSLGEAVLYIGLPLLILALLLVLYRLILAVRQEYRRFREWQRQIEAWQQSASRELVRLEDGKEDKPMPPGFSITYAGDEDDKIASLLAQAARNGWQADEVSPQRWIFRHGTAVPVTYEHRQGNDVQFLRALRTLAEEQATPPS